MGTTLIGAASFLDNYREGLEVNQHIHTLNAANGFKWTASGNAGTNEYYCTLTAGTDPSLDDHGQSDNGYGPLTGIPTEGKSNIFEATLGTLTDHDWGYGDDDALGFSTVYVRDDSGDPDVTELTIKYPSLHLLDISAGSCLDSTNSVLMTLSADLTQKDIETAWAAGSSAGVLDTGSIAADTIYAVWLIMRSDTGVVDALISTSMTSPTMPANYDYKRFIGYIWTDSNSKIKPFYMAGREIWFLKGSESIILNAARGGYDTWADTGNPVDLSDYLPVGHYESVLFGCKSTTDTAKLILSIFGSYAHSTIQGRHIDNGDTEQNAWSYMGYDGQYHFVPIQGDQIYIDEAFGYCTNIILLIHAVRLKY